MHIVCGFFHCFTFQNVIQWVCHGSKRSRFGKLCLLVCLPFLVYPSKLSCCCPIVPCHFWVHAAIFCNSLPFAAITFSSLLFPITPYRSLLLPVVSCRSLPNGTVSLLYRVIFLLLSCCCLYLMSILLPVVCLLSSCSLPGGILVLSCCLPAAVLLYPCPAKTEGRRRDTNLLWWRGPSHSSKASMNHA